jgi:hypothetical protein
MLKMFFNTKRWVFVAAVSISACAMNGCLESSFRLANDSGLPRGLPIPPGLTRADVSARVDFWGLPYHASITLRDQKGRKIATATGRYKSGELYLRTTRPGSLPGFPTYSVLQINGQYEVLEQRQRNDILYVTDDPAIRQEILAGRAVEARPAPDHKVSGNFLLVQGESGFYLMSDWQTVNVAGPLHQIGWNKQYIIFTDANWPKPWNVMRVKDHTKFTITDAQRTTDPAFNGISIMSPTDAWNSKGH